MAAKRFQLPTADDKLELVSFAAKDAIIVYQDAKGRVFETWPAYVFANLECRPC
jgi:hypothetical protein